MRYEVKRVIDIHSHFLPEVDDGFASELDSLDALKKFAEEGVTDIICTPHHRRRYNLPPKELQKRFEDFKKKAQDIPVNLYLGQEIYAQEDIRSDLKDGKLLPLNGTKYILIEFSFHTEAEISDVCYELVRLGYKPIVAHLERYSYADVLVAEDIHSVGGLVQINADSLVDKSGKAYRKKARALIRSGQVDFIASDCHKGRALCFKAAIKYVAKKRGAEEADRLFFKNAEKITDEN